MKTNPTDKNATSVAFAMYKPKEGQADKLREILSTHIPTLRQYGLVTERNAYTLQSADGTVIEVFEWQNEQAARSAHEHPAIRTIWGQMEGVCDFPTLKDLPEAKRPFPNFDFVNQS
jgi:hypothetical protein